MKKHEKAIKEINDLLETNNNDPISFTEARVDHYRDIEQLTGAKVVFSEAAMKRIIDFMVRTDKEHTIEHGAFLYGHILGNILYVEKCGMEMKTENGIFINGAVEITEDNVSELNSLTSESPVNLYPYDLVVDFHTHPDYVIKDDDVYKANSVQYSDQDLYRYAYEQTKMNKKRPIMYIGVLGPINNGKFLLNTVFYDTIKKDFVNIPDMYCFLDGDVVKINNTDLETNLDINSYEKNSIKRKVLSYISSKK